MELVKILFLLIFSTSIISFASLTPAQNKAYEKALNKTLLDMRIAPNIPDNYLIAAKIYQKLSRTDNAVSIYKKLLSNNQITDPESIFKAHFYLGSLYLFSKKYPLAKTHLKEALIISPNSIPARMNLGATYLNNKDYLPAINEFQTILSGNPNYAIVYFNLAKCFENLKKPSEANNNYRIFLDIIGNESPKNQAKFSNFIKIAQEKFSSKKRKLGPQIISIEKN